MNFIDIKTHGTIKKTTTNPKPSAVRMYSSINSFLSVNDRQKHVKLFKHPKGVVPT